MKILPVGTAVGLGLLLGIWGITLGGVNKGVDKACYITYCIRSYVDTPALTLSKEHQMPVRQDRILRLVASAKAYRMLVNDIVSRLQNDAVAINRGILTIPIKEYNHDLLRQYHTELLDVERLHSVVIDLTDEYYTEAIIRRNDKNKEAQRKKREAEGVQPKKPAVRVTNKLLEEIKSPMDTANIPEPITTMEQEEEMRKIMEQMGVKSRD